MMPHEQNAPADLRIEILRGNAVPHAPPPPLAICWCRRRRRGPTP
jgi:hypothetical protein